jgi:hypothetical protein
MVAHSTFSGTTALPVSRKRAAHTAPSCGDYLLLIGMNIASICLGVGRSADVIVPIP